MEKAFIDLCRELGNARTALRLLHAGTGGDPEITAAAASLIAIAGEALDTAERGRKAARIPVNIDVVRRSLPKCQRQISRLMKEFRDGVNAPERMRAYPPEVAWAVGRCAAPMFAADWAISACWRKAAEYAALNPGGVMPSFVPRP